MTSPKILLAVCMAAVCGCTGLAAAQTAPATPATAATVAMPAIPETLAAPAATATPSLGAVLAATPGLSITGYVASTYDHFNTSSTTLRAFDTTPNGFRLNQAAMTMAYLPSSGAGAQVTLIGGSDAKILRNGEIPLCVTSAGTQGCSSNQFDPMTAFVQYAVGSLTVMAGKFPALAGAEVINPAADTNISRSILFWDMEPSTLTGLRATYAVSGALTLTAGVDNGWNFTSSPANAAKTMELGISGSPSKMFSYSGAYYRGQSPLYGGSATGVLQLLDLVGTVNATSSLSFVGNVDILSKGDYLGAGTGTGHANGLALYANYAINPMFMLSARGEYIDDKNGIVTTYAGGVLPAGVLSNKLKELTLTLNYACASNLKLSAEVRQDKSAAPVFTRNGSSTTRQTSLELQAVYSF